MKLIKYFVGFLMIFIITGGIVLFTTPIGHEVRVTAAEIILSSQHRHWAKYTFLPESELETILKKIQNPKYENSVEIGEEYTREINSVSHQSKENELVVTLTTIEKHYSPAYFYKGKILEVSNPKNVKLVSSNKRDHGEQIFVIADRVNAIAAINASGFVDNNGRGNGGSATGVIIEDGEIKNKYPNQQDYVAGVTTAGKLITGKYSGNELKSLGVKYAAGFKPQLIVNGEKMITEGDGGWGIGPRTAIGQKKDGTIVMIVVDGRQPKRSIGATLREIQDILYDKGVVNAMSMDGGSSSSMYFNQENITTPSSRNNIPRYLPNIWAVVSEPGQKVILYEDGKLIKN